jgi:hypothetical protein
MRKIVKLSVIAASLAAFVLAVMPDVAGARGMGSGSTKGTTCKSGKRVGDASKCKENGGKL